tara:strand:+ start:216 stop:569 length:354 start_codon:yes stop_codon:yes gene_type:complete
MTKPYFNKRLYPITTNCQTLDAQVSKLRDDKDLVFRNLMNGDKKEVKNFLLAKEVQFENQRCSQSLEDSSVYGTIDMTQDEFEKLEKRIIGESDKKRNFMLVTGGVVLIIALAIFIK